MPLLVIDLVFDIHPSILGRRDELARVLYGDPVIFRTVSQQHGDFDLAGARQFAETIRRMISDQPFEYEGDTFPVTISIGVATVEGEDIDAAAFIKVADDLLYRAKREGRNRVVG